MLERPPKRTVEATRRAAANARTRRYRERQAKGLGIAPTPYSDEIVALLLDIRWLSASESEDRYAIGRAIFAMLSEAARNR